MHPERVVEYLRALADEGVESGLVLLEAAEIIEQQEHQLRRISATWPEPQIQPADPNR